MPEPLVLRTALGLSPLVRALKDGRITSDRVRFDFVDVEPVTRAFRRMTRAMEFDLCEMALTTHAQARAFGKPITALPVVLLRGLHHGALICRRDSTLRGPADLVGKRIGVRAWSQTTGVWVRGVLRDEYGVAHDSMTWVTEEDAHVQEFVDPPFVQRMAAGQDLRAMLLSGEIDAAVALAGIRSGGGSHSHTGRRCGGGRMVTPDRRLPDQPHRRGEGRAAGCAPLAG